MDRWSSRGGFLLAAIGAAVGLGNVWRFSAVVGRNGGGAYLVPYLLSAFAFALPLLVLEFSVGRSLRTDVVGAFRTVGDRYEPLGWVVTGAVGLLLSYYLVLTGWVLSFFVAAVGGRSLSFAAYVGGYWPVVAFVVATALTGGIVALGVRGGIERMSTLVMPTVFVVLLGLGVYAATLDGFGDGVAFLFTPDPAVLGDPGVWSAAIGQVFFSLSVGQGIMLTYGSYLGQDVDIVRSALVITVADVLVALVAGLVIFPIVFTFGLAPTLGTELAFTTLPTAFERMAAGRVVAVGFFGLLFFAALSSAVALLEVVVSVLVRETGRSRHRVAALATVGVFLLGLPSALSYSAVGLSVGGVPVLDAMDETVGAYALPVTAVCIAVVFVWFQPRDRVRAQVGDGPVVALVKYVIPPVLVVVTAVRLGVGRTMRAWLRAPPGHAVDPRTGAAVTLVVVAALAGLGAVVARRLAGRRR